MEKLNKGISQLNMVNDEDDNEDDDLLLEGLSTTTNMPNDNNNIGNNNDENEDDDLLLEGLSRNMDNKTAAADHDDNLSLNSLVLLHTREILENNNNNNDDDDDVAREMLQRDSSQIKWRRYMWIGIEDYPFWPGFINIKSNLVHIFFQFGFDILSNFFVLKKKKYVY